MNKNVGTIDRAVRTILGTLLLVVAIAGFTGTLSLTVGPLSTTLTAAIALVFGAVFGITGAVGTCPLYTLVGLDTQGTTGEPTKERPV